MAERYGIAKEGRKQWANGLHIILHGFANLGILALHSLAAESGNIGEIGRPRSFSF